MPRPTPERTPTPQKDWVALAVFTQPHGVSGRMKVKSFTDPLHAFASHADLTDAKGNALRLRITGDTPGGAIVAIDGVTRREQAELLRGLKIGVARAALPKLSNPNQFYTDDLVGMAVVDEKAMSFGQVRAVVNYGAGDILDIVHRDGSDGLYAFNHATFPQVDLAARVIVIQPPEVLEARPEALEKGAEPAMSPSKRRAMARSGNRARRIL